MKGGNHLEPSRKGGVTRGAGRVPKSSRPRVLSATRWQATPERSEAPTPGWAPQLGAPEPRADAHVTPSQVVGLLSAREALGGDVEKQQQGDLSLILPHNVLQQPFFLRGTSPSEQQQPGERQIPHPQGYSSPHPQDLDPC